MSFLEKKTYCFVFSCSKPASPLFRCELCEKVLFCSNNCLLLHKKETHPANISKEISLCFLGKYQITKDISPNFRDKMPPFEGFAKRIFLVKKTKSDLKEFLLVKKKIDKSGLSRKQIEGLSQNLKEIKGLSHPHLLKMIEFIEETSSFSIVFEKFSAKTIRTLLNEKKKLKEKNAFIYFTQVSLVTEYLTKKGVGFVNFELDNLLLDDKMDIKLCDFHRKTSEFSLEKILLALLFGESSQETCHISQEAQNLLGLLRNLKYPLSNFQEIFQHSWMKRHCRLFNVDIERFRCLAEKEDPKKNDLSKSERNSFKTDESPAKNLLIKAPERRSSVQNSKNCVVNTTSSEKMRETPPANANEEEFSFRIQQNQFKSFTFYKSSSPSSNPTINSSQLMKSSGGNSSGKALGKYNKEELNNSKKESQLLKLQKCEESIFSEKNEIIEEKKEAPEDFWRKLAHFIGCGCFNTAKK